jgi:hypothetical protein
MLFAPPPHTLHQCNRSIADHLRPAQPRPRTSSRSPSIISSSSRSKTYRTQQSPPHSYAAVAAVAALIPRGHTGPRSGPYSQSQPSPSQRIVMRHNMTLPPSNTPIVVPSRARRTDRPRLAQPAAYIGRAPPPSPLPTTTTATGGQRWGTRICRIWPSGVAHVRDP